VILQDFSSSHGGGNVRVAQVGSFTGAAEQLGLPKSTVSLELDLSPRRVI
jgi:hypothetical protein